MVLYNSAKMLEMVIFFVLNCDLVQASQIFSLRPVLCPTLI